MSHRFLTSIAVLWAVAFAFACVPEPDGDDGGSLADYIQRVGALPPSRVGKLGAALAATLAAAHSAGVLHRDLKPSNVLLDADGAPVLSDFGAAGFVDAAVTFTHETAPEMHSAIIRATKPA